MELLRLHRTPTLYLHFCYPFIPVPVILHPSLPCYLNCSLIPPPSLPPSLPRWMVSECKSSLKVVWTVPTSDDSVLCGLHCALHGSDLRQETRRGGSTQTATPGVSQTPHSIVDHSKLLTVHVRDLLTYYCQCSTGGIYNDIWKRGNTALTCTNHRHKPQKLDVYVTVFLFIPDVCCLIWRFEVHIHQ